mgnify:CR=1 FL=1
MAHQQQLVVNNPLNEFLQSDQEVIGEEDSFITRLNTDANDNNRGKTI